VLSALNRKNKQIIPAMLTRKELMSLRSETFYCPECKAKVILRAGTKVIPHFAHQKSSTCTISHHGESVYHQQAKFLLYEWLRRQQFQVALEKHISSINQRPDIFLTIRNTSIAIEFQSSSVPIHTIQQRNEGYTNAFIHPIWIVSAKKLHRLTSKTFRVSYFYQQLIFHHKKSAVPTLFYFCPNSKIFTILSDLYFYNMNYVFANSFCRSLHCLHFFELFKTRRLSKRLLYECWFKKKRQFRLSPRKVFGRELHFRRWLYNQKLHVERLPSYIYLPIHAQYKMNVPPWHWQSKLIIELLHPLPINAIITIDCCCHFIQQYVSPQYKHEAKEVIMQYFMYLEKLHIIRKISNHRWVKISAIQFHRYIEQSLKADDKLLQYLLN